MRPRDMQSISAIRHSFIEYFKSKGHTHLPSSPLIPANDPSLLFTNAGMVQFKDVFLGHEAASCRRAVTSQRCVRAGGKHNDLENVGYTKRHHTFFEMLGNFSFADYAKEEAIMFAWEYLTEVVELPPDKLWVTVFDQDSEAEQIWLKKIGVDGKRFSRIGEKDNFWTMGDIGPCGPCTEIFYDHGPNIEGGAPDGVNDGGDRYIELWNLVFMQYERTADGKQHALDKLSVDTGMGLERLSAVLQGVHDNYDIDLFQNLIKRTAELTKCHDLSSSSLKVIADHIRSASFLITDGITPSNEGRGYVLRRIIRRALRHGHKLGVAEPFFYLLVDELVQQMGEAYPELSAAKQSVMDVLQGEEQKFSETLAVGMKLLEETIADLSSKELSGEVIFKLYDTYGFPADLTADVARERGLSLDMSGFEMLMEAQKRLAKRSSGFSASGATSIKIDHQQHDFSGYQTMQDQGHIVALFCNDQPVKELNTGEEGIVILDKTPFYGESGGQIGDRGSLQTSRGVFDVRDTQKQGPFHKHIGCVNEGQLVMGDEVISRVDIERRKAIMRNHSATHLMHAALRAVLGDHVAQKGSLVAEDRLRFDFSHNVALSDTQIEQIEALVNEQVEKDVAVEEEFTSQKQAIEQGAVALFGEKYGEEVRVLTMGDFSKELCGGTHVAHTGEIGVFKITAQSNVASGVRRIEAVTGEGVKQYLAQQCHTLDAQQQRFAAKVVQMEEGQQSQTTEGIQNLTDIQDVIQQNAEQIDVLSRALDGQNFVSPSVYRDVRQICQLLKTQQAKLFEWQQVIKQLDKRVDGLDHTDTQNLATQHAQQAVDINGIKVIATQIEPLSKKIMRALLDQLKEEFPSAVIVLAAVNQGRVTLLAGVTDNLTHQFRADKLVNDVAQYVDGKGGGRADMAEAGGKDPTALQQALATVPEQVRLGLQS